jgi:hypothetical protein
VIFAGQPYRRGHGVDSLRRCGLDGMTPDSSLLQTVAPPLGSLTPADRPLIDAEKLFRQPGPPLGAMPDETTRLGKISTFLAI